MTQPLASSAPGPRQARGWRIGLSCLGVLSLISAAFASIFLFAWVALAKTDPYPFPAPALLGFLPAFAALGLGAWTWRRKKVWWLASLTAVVGGALGLAFAAGYLVFGVLMMRST